MRRSILLPLSAVSLAGALAVGLVGCKKGEEGAANSTAPPDAQIAPAANAPAANAPAPAALPSVTDAGVKAKIKNAINLSKKIDHKRSSISVDVTPSQVTLTGTAASAQDKQEAIRLAKANAGTRKTVADQLKLAATP